MREINISINQLADFSKSSDAKKRNIVKQQKNPNTFKIAYYQLAKARIKKAMSNKGDIEPILKGIEELKTRTLTKKRQINDRVVSLDAMQRFISLQIPDLLKDLEYKVIKNVNSKSITINGVEVIVSPDIIIQAEIEGKQYLGGIKIHIAKENKFDREQQSYVASTIQKYLEKVVAKNDEVIMPELCLSIDIFGEGIVSAPKNIDSKIKDLEIICDEIKKMWYAA
ncbi:hypothetical protein [Flavobacterium oreochromis]|uniref:Uncharacterized protein n=1 Tax=Flavobacterium columnare TaxID=996 RepID=A0A246G985_9FLAO|nr:hypothetical protein [Flavobacterium oreochromis]OWP75949.1 hypothetical protein BWK62_10855 [Flavobacterium oreochromis]